MAGMSGQQSLEPTEEAKPFEQLVQRIEPQGRLLRRWTLRGGVSAQVTGLEIALADGRTKKWIARRHGAVDLKRNPQIAADEFKLLQWLHAAGLALETILETACRELALAFELPQAAANRCLGSVGKGVGE